MHLDRSPAEVHAQGRRDGRLDQTQTGWMRTVRNSSMVQFSSLVRVGASVYIPRDDCMVISRRSFGTCRVTRKKMRIRAHVLFRNSIGLPSRSRHSATFLCFHISIRMLSNSFAMLVPTFLCDHYRWPMTNLSLRRYVVSCLIRAYPGSCHRSA